jgi:hypothetical protein
LKLNKALGAIALIAGGVILTLALNGGQFVTCGKWTGCTSHGDPLTDSAGAVLILFAGGFGLAAVGVFLLASGQESSKPFFGRADQASS